MKKLLLLLSFLWLTSPVSAMTQIFVSGSTTTAISNSATNYLNTISTDRVPTTTESSSYRLISYKGKISNLNVYLSGTAGAGKSYVFTLRKNAADTALTCTISGASATTCSDTSNVIEVDAGDMIDISSVPSGTPTAQTYKSNLRYDSAGSNRISTYSYNVNGQNLTNSAVRYFPINGSNFSNTPSAEGTGQVVISQGGDFKHLYVTILAAPGAGKSYTFTLRKNAADTALTCVISGASATSCADMSNSVSVAAGDLLDLAVTPSGTPTATPGIFGMSLSSSTPGNFMIIGTSMLTNTSVSATNYLTFSGTSGAVNASGTSSAIVGRLIEQLYFKAMYVRMANAPDNGADTQSYTVSLYDSTSTANTASTCTLSEAATTCNYTSGFNLATSNQYTYSIVPTNTPTASPISVSIAVNFLTPNQPATLKNAVLKNSTINGY